MGTLSVLDRYRSREYKRDVMLQVNLCEKDNLLYEFRSLDLCSLMKKGGNLPSPFSNVTTLSGEVVRHQYVYHCEDNTYCYFNA